MQKVQKIIITMIIVLTIISLIIGIVVIKNRESSTSKTEYYPIDEIPLKPSLQPVKERNGYYMAKNCINKFYIHYMNAFNMTIEDYETEEMLQEAKREYSKVLYNMLDTEYIVAKEITTDNVLTKFDKINDSSVSIKEMYVSEKTTNIFVYLAKGSLIENVSRNVLPFEIIVKIDFVNQTFSIIPQNYVIEKFNNLHVGDILEIDILNNIEVNDNNRYNFQQISEDDYITDLFNQYKQELIYNRELAYEHLDEDYKNKRFETLDKFEQYAKDNIRKHVIMKLDKYQKTVTDEYTQYVCIDTYGNYYIFRETSVMNYKVILDTYTLELPEFIEKYNNSSENEKALLNIQEIFEAINSRDYRYVYNKLDKTFKANNFKTLSEFEKYIKEHMYTNNKISYSDYQKSGDLYIYNIKIADKDGEKTEQISKTFVVKLLEGTDFVFSFSVE